MMRAPGLARAADKIAQMRRGGGRQDGNAGTAGDEAALLDVLALARRGWDCFVGGDRHYAFVRIGKAAAPAFALTATPIVALVDLSRPSSGNSGRSLSAWRSLCAISQAVS